MLISTEKRSKEKKNSEIKFRLTGYLCVESSKFATKYEQLMKIPDIWKKTKVFQFDLFVLNRSQYALYHTTHTHTLNTQKFKVSFE